jgi:protein SCO1/2
MKHILGLSILLILLWSCSGSNTRNPEKKPAKKELPVLTTETISEFEFTSQTGNVITRDSLLGKICVADFFFTTCPTICPLMKSQMIRVYEKYKTRSDFRIISHTIDPEHDNVEVLKAFSDKLEVDPRFWYFVTGNKDSIYTMAERYMVSASADPGAPGGFIHSGAFILLDKKGLIRGYYDGTKEQAVDSLITDIGYLLNENSN